MDNVWTNLGNRLETTWKRPTRPNEFDPIYDECRASDFFWATAAVEFAGIDKMTLKEVLAAV